MNIKEVWKSQWNKDCPLFLVKKNKLVKGSLALTTVLQDMLRTTKIIMSHLVIQRTTFQMLQAIAYIRFLCLFCNCIQNAYIIMQDQYNKYINALFFFLIFLGFHFPPCGHLKLENQLHISHLINFLVVISKANVTLKIIDFMNL